MRKEKEKREGKKRRRVRKDNLEGKKRGREEKRKGGS